MPGSPATPDHPAARKVAYLLIGLYLAVVGGLQNGLLIANLTFVQSNLALTPVEGGWVTVAFNLTNACMSMLLFKARQEFGIQRFVRVAMSALLFANFVQLFDAGYHVELLSRGIAGIAGSCISTLATFYLIQGMPAKAKIVAVLIGIGLGQIAIPLARAISPALLASGDIDHLFQLQFGLSLVAVGLVNILHLPPGETVRSFEKLDLISFPLLTSGIGLLCAFLVQGRIIWWDKPWLGAALAGAILLIGLAFLIEHNRANPMLHTRWMTSGNILAFALTGAMVRVLLSEQNFGATGLLSTVGMVNDQLVTYYWILTLAAFLGSTVSIVRLDPTDLTRPIMVAMGIIAVAALLDTRSGVLTRPANLYWTQALLAFASVYVMASLMMQGILRALSRGPDYIISFIAVFGLSQTIGGLAGVAALSAFHTIRVKAHLMTMGQSLSLSDPAVAQAIGQLAAGQSATLGDAALRQATGASRLVQQVNQQAAIMAFNDVFFVIGCLAGAAFAITFARWAYLRRKGINPLADEMAALQTMMSRNA
ncbi:MFS transporter [Sphingobium cloacae]|nr:MFS transporter [Sphingobium cloacae]